MKTTLKITDHLGKPLHAIRWLPEDKPRGIVLIVHGLAEHSERYNHFAKYLTGQGLLTIAYDHRGHGLTDPDQLGFISEKDGFDLLVWNLYDVIQFIEENYPNLPVFLFSHSMGSFITQRFMQIYDYKPDGIIYSGSNGRPPLLLHAGIAISAFIKKLYGTDHKSSFLERLSFGAYNRHFKPNRTNSDWLSRDTDMVDLYMDDPYCGFISSASLYHQLFLGIRQIHSHRPFADHDRSIPILLLSGTDDPVSNMGKGFHNLIRILQRDGITNLTTKHYENGRHEMVNELNRNEVFADILTWINNTLKD